MWVAEVEAYRSGADDGKGEGAERVTLELERGAYDVKFRTKAEGRARECGLDLDGENIGAVYSRPLPWTEHHLVVEAKKVSKLVIGGEGVQVAQAAAEPRQGPGGESMAPIAQLKDTHLQTPLADAVIAAPAGDEFQRLAEQVQAKVREVCGLELPIRPAAEVAKSEVESRTVIAFRPRGLR